MKTTIKMLTVLAVAGMMIFFACQKEKKQNAIEQSLADASNNQHTDAMAIGDTIPESIKHQGWFPQDSKVEFKGSSLQITAPLGWAYLGYDQEQSLFYFAKNEPTITSITCTCNANGSCKAFYAHGPWGTTGGCTGVCKSCTMEQTFSSAKKTVVPGTGGFYQPDAVTRLLKGGETIPAVFDALAATKEFQSKLEALYELAYQGRPVVQVIKQKDGSVAAPEGYSLVGASIMSRGLLVLLPNDFVKSVLGYVGTDSASCSCSRQGGCKLHNVSVPGLGSMWCDGDCNGCKLFMNKAVEYQVRIFSAGM